MTEIKPLYVIQPILLGGKFKSIAIIIPAKVARALNINDSTVLTLKPDEVHKSIKLENLNVTA